MKHRIALLTLCLIAAGGSAQDMEGVEITAEEVGPDIWVLFGRGGNIGVSAGDDGVFLVDDQFAPLTPLIQKAVAEISSEPIRFVINTHWHGDHVGGNENLGKAGALIVAHDNVRQRMSTKQFMEALGNREVPPKPAEALPVVTFDNAVTFHMNGEQIHAFHVEDAHTDGDSIIHFRDANVIHMGDTYFNGLYPFIDWGSGGSINGMIAAVNQGLELANEQTRIIPGHGPISNLEELQFFRDLLVTVRDRVQGLIDQGKTLDEIKAAKPSAEFDETWGVSFIKPDQFATLVYESLVREGK